MVEPGSVASANRLGTPIGRSYPGFRREAVNRSRIAKTRGKAMKFKPGDMLRTTVMEAVTGEAIDLPDPKRLAFPSLHDE